MPPTISSLLIECMGSFSQLITSGDLKEYDSEVHKDLWEDELGRLRVWASNIGAHQTGQSSLDFRLRDASHIKRQTIKLLEALRRTLSNLGEVLAEPAPVDDLNSDDGEDGTEIQQIYKAFVDTVNCLFQMSMMIRRPARHDQLLGTKRADTAGFEPFDRQHVSNKYPHAAQEIAERLGAGISRRRAALKYRERHNAKMKKGIGRIAGDQSDAASNNLSDTVATEYVDEDSVFEDTFSQSGISQTSYAQTLLNGRDAMKIPPPPKESANESPFECPYCYFIVTIKNKRAWARHIFTDIMPYICVYEDCSMPNRLYASRREWFRHLQIAHSVSTTSQTCPLCRETIAAGSLFQKHLGRHLEELALFAMPRIAQDDDGADSIASDRSNRGGGRVNEYSSDAFGEDDDDDDEENEVEVEYENEDKEHDIRAPEPGPSDSIPPSARRLGFVPRFPDPDQLPNPKLDHPVFELPAYAEFPEIHENDIAASEGVQGNDGLRRRTAAPENETLSRDQGQPGTSYSSQGWQEVPRRRDPPLVTFSSRQELRDAVMARNLMREEGHCPEPEKQRADTPGPDPDPDQANIEHREHGSNPSGKQIPTGNPHPQQSTSTQPKQTIPELTTTPVTSDHRVSWTSGDDDILLQVRAQGHGWNQIRRDHFPNKTANALRKRYERVTYRRGSDAKDDSNGRVMLDENSALASEIRVRDAAGKVVPEIRLEEPEEEAVPLPRSPPQSSYEELGHRAQSTSIRVTDAGGEVVPEIRVVEEVAKLFLR